MSKLSVSVIGAGICGVSAAIWLQRTGHRVTLIDAKAPGQGASYGNAGLLASWSMGPAATPDVRRALPKMILSRTSGLFFKWRSVPGNIKWMWDYLRNTNDAQTRACAHAWRPLLGDAWDEHTALSQGTIAQNRLTHSQFCYIYPDTAAFEADRYSWDLKAELGLVPTVLTGAAARAEMPMLGPKMTCIAKFDRHGHIREPGAYVAELAQYFVDQGGRFIQQAVTDIERRDGRISAVVTKDHHIPCDRAVVTAGIGSRELMQKIGLNVPLIAERGYHVIYKNAAPLPPYPMLVAGKFGITPMGSDLRCAGTVELTGTDPTPSKAPIAFIKEFVRTAFPNLTYDSTEEWLGFRPSTPDSLPVIGEIGGSGIYAGFGHQHLGLTSGPKTGRLLAQLVSDQPPNIDLSAYSPDRYSA